MKSDEAYMRLAIEEALRGRQAGEFPFGAVLVDAAGDVVMSRHDTVEADGDKSSHAETMLVKRACQRLGPDLSGYTVFTTTEPCPMCFTTCWLARVGRVVYGCTMRDVYEQTGGAVNELAVPVEVMDGYGDGRVSVVGGVLAEECLAMFDAWTMETTA